MILANDSLELQASPAPSSGSRDVDDPHSHRRYHWIGVGCDLIRRGETLGTFCKMLWGDSISRPATKTVADDASDFAANVQRLFGVSTRGAAARIAKADTELIQSRKAGAQQLPHWLDRFDQVEKAL